MDFNTFCNLSRKWPPNILIFDRIYKGFHEAFPVLVKCWFFTRFYKVFRVCQISLSFTDKPNAFLILLGHFAANGTQRSSYLTGFIRVFTRRFPFESNADFHKVL